MLVLVLCSLLLLLFLLHRTVVVVRCSLFHTPLHHTPLNTVLPFIRSFDRPPLLEVWSQQGSVVKSLRIWGREPLRSASHLLGFHLDLCFWDPGDSLVAGPSYGPRCRDPICLVVPDSLLGRHWIVYCSRDLVALKLIAPAFKWARDRLGCHWRSRDRPGNFTGAPLRRRSAGISVSDAGCVGGRTVSGTHDIVNPLIYAPYFGASGPSLLIDEAVGYVDWPISKTKAQLSGYAGAVLGLATC